MGKRGCRRYALVCHRSASVRSDKPYERRDAPRRAGRPQGRRTRLWRHWGHVYRGTRRVVTRGLQRARARAHAAISEPRAAVTGFSERRDVSIIDSTACTAIRFLDFTTTMPVCGVCALTER